MRTRELKEFYAFKVRTNSENCSILFFFIKTPHNSTLESALFSLCSTCIHLSTFIWLANASTYKCYAGALIIEIEVIHSIKSPVKIVY